MKENVTRRNFLATAGTAALARKRLEIASNRYRSGLVTYLQVAIA